MSCLHNFYHSYYGCSMLAVMILDNIESFPYLKVIAIPHQMQVYSSRVKCILLDKTSVVDVEFFSCQQCWLGNRCFLFIPASTDGYIIAALFSVLFSHHSMMGTLIVSKSLLVNYVVGLCTKCNSCRHHCH